MYSLTLTPHLCFIRSLVAALLVWSQRFSTRFYALAGWKPAKRKAAVLHPFLRYTASWKTGKKSPSLFASFFCAIQRAQKKAKNNL
jgi:hypothetical protein